MYRAGTPTRPCGSALALALALVSLAACADSPPALVSAGPITIAAAGASNPTVALDAGAATYIAWVGTEAGVSNVYLARAPGADDFAAPVRVNHVPGDAAPHAQAPAQVAAGPEGNVYVVWQNNTPVAGREFPASDLRLARSTDGGVTFEPAIFINDDAGGPPSSHTFHDIAVAPDGAVYVSWIDGRRGEHDRAARHGGPGATAAAAGAAPAGPDIRVARSTDGGRSFGTGTIVDAAACPCCRTTLAIGADGAVYIAWRKVYEGNVRDIVVARSIDGAQSFAPPVRVHEDGWVFEGCPHAGAGLAVDAAGRIHVAWYTGSPARTGIFHAVSDDGARSFGAPAPLTPDAHVPTSQVKLSVDGRGAVWIAWEGTLGDAPVIRLARSTDGRPPVAAETAEPAGLLPAIAASGDRLALAWLDGQTVRAVRARQAAR